MVKRSNDSASQVSPGIGTQETAVGRSVEQRQHERYETAKPLILVAVLADGTLDWANRCVGMSVNVSAGGMGMIVDRQAGQMPRSVLVGVEDEAGEI